LPLKINLGRLVFFWWVLLGLGVVLAVTPLAGAAEGPAPPTIAAKSAVLINADDGRVLFSQNPDERLPMASTTKMMTALLVIEDCQDLNAPVTTSQRAAEVGESSIYLQPGETLTVREMLNGMLIQSGNDAATALAEYDAGSVEAFVEKMNKRAAELGLSNTHFANPHGLDDPQHYTSAADLAKLGSELMKHSEIREIVKRPEYTIPQSGQPFGRLLINHNHLLGQYSFINGIKTGYTDNAGQCIVISANDHGVGLILSYLGGSSLAGRDQDVINLLKFGFDSYRDRAVITAGEEYASLKIPYSRDKRLSLVSADSLVKQVYVNDEVQHRLVLPEDLSLPVHKGDKVGIVEAYEGDTMLGCAYLVAAEDVPEPGLGEKLFYYLSSIFHVFGRI